MVDFRLKFGLGARQSGDPVRDEATLLDLWGQLKQALSDVLKCASVESAQLAQDRAWQLHQLIRATPAYDFDGLAIKLGLALWTSDGSFDEIAEQQIRGVYTDLTALVSCDPVAELEAIDQNDPAWLSAQAERLRASTSLSLIEANGIRLRDAHLIHEPPSRDQEELTRTIR